MPSRKGKRYMESVSQVRCREREGEEDSCFKIKARAQKKAGKSEREGKPQDEEKAKLRELQEKEGLEAGDRDPSKEKGPQEKLEEETVKSKVPLDRGVAAASDEKGGAPIAAEDDKGAKKRTDEKEHGREGREGKGPGKAPVNATRRPWPSQGGAAGARSGRSEGRPSACTA